VERIDRLAVSEKARRPQYDVQSGPEPFEAPQPPKVGATIARLDSSHFSFY